MPRLISACSISPPARMKTKLSARGLMTWPTDAPARRERCSTKFGVNMTYLVEFTSRAARDLEILYIEKNAAESYTAARWYNNLKLAAYALALHAQHSPVAPETRSVKQTARRNPYEECAHALQVIY